MTQRAARLTLWCVAITAALLGALFLVAPVTTNDRIDPTISPTESAVAPSARADNTIGEEIAMANVFSSRRTAPSARYRPTDDSISTLGTSVADAGAMALERTGEAANAAPTLFGTVVGVGGTPSRALLLLDASSSAPRLYGEGEGDGGYRVITILPRSVVLRGANGRITLRLDQEEKRP